MKNTNSCGLLIKQIHTTVERTLHDLKGTGENAAACPVHNRRNGGKARGNGGCGFLPDC